MPESGKLTAADWLIGALYVAAIGLNIYLVADQMSNGELGRNLSMKAVTLQGKLRYWLEDRKHFNKAKAHVVWEAIQTVEGDET